MLARLYILTLGLSRQRRAALALLLGALSALALPPWHLVPLIVPAFAGLLWREVPAELDPFPILYPNSRGVYMQFEQRVGVTDTRSGSSPRASTGGNLDFRINIETPATAATSRTTPGNRTQGVCWPLSGG